MNVSGNHHGSTATTPPGPTLVSSSLHAADRSSADTSLDGMVSDAPKSSMRRAGVADIFMTGSTSCGTPAHMAGEMVVGGVIANWSDRVVGLSNVFTVDHDVDRIWAGAVATVAARFPDLTLVGYETGSDLDAARADGFEAPARCARGGKTDRDPRNFPEVVVSRPP